MRDDNRLKTIGLRGTAIYLILLFGGIPVLAYFGAITLKPLELNSLGDFLAGAFGPLALVWVVLGFLQQGEELKNSSAALSMQAEELRKATEQHRQLVQASRDSLEFEKSEHNRLLAENKERLQPKFDVRLSGSTREEGSELKIECALTVANYGANAFDIKVHQNKRGESSRKLIAESHVMKKNDWFAVDFGEGALCTWDLHNLFITYSDEENDRTMLQYEILLIDDSIRGTDPFPKFKAELKDKTEIPPQGSIIT